VRTLGSADAFRGVALDDAAWVDAVGGMPGLGFAGCVVCLGSPAAMGRDFACEVA
jgi:hypothetical protein